MAAIFVMACLGQNVSAQSLTETANTGASTLIVYYSYTNNTEQIVNDLRTLVAADVIEVEPVDKTLKYEANGYQIGTEQLSKINSNPSAESSYPAIDPIMVDMSKYICVIIATPLWWSQMASNMQTFLFKYGKEMAGKNIGLIVSSHSSGISGVEADARRLVPNGNFVSNSLWINASNHPNRKVLLERWMDEFSLTTGISDQQLDASQHQHIFDLNGKQLVAVPEHGIFIENGVKKIK